MNLKIYEYWFEYLKRSKGYKECCEAGGVGEYWALHEDFGNVHAVTFEKWWETHKRLFTDKQTRPPMDRITQVSAISQRDLDSPETLVVNINVYEKFPVLTNALRDLLKEIGTFRYREPDDSTSEYFVATEMRLDTLSNALDVYDKVESERTAGSSVNVAYTEAGKAIKSIREKYCAESGTIVHPEDLIAEVKELYLMAKTIIENVAQPDAHFAELNIRCGRSSFPVPTKTPKTGDDWQALEQNRKGQQ